MPPPLEPHGLSVALSVEGKSCLAILAFAIILWVSKALPFAVTSLFVILLIRNFGIKDYAAVILRYAHGQPR